MSTSDSKVRTIYIVLSGTIESDGKLYFRDPQIYIQSDADGYLKLSADVGIKLDADVVMQAGKQLDASADGVVLPTKAGSFSDADFANPVDGLIGIDTSNNAICFRSGGSWYNVAGA